MTRLKGKAKAKARKQKSQNSAASKQSYKKKMLSMILKYNDEALEKKCEDVAVGSDVSKTISTMKKILGLTDNGVGLAASQIGIMDRVIVIRPDSSKYEIKAMINPEIISYSEEKKYGPEMCLSYPGVTGFIERFTSIEVKYFDEKWNERIVSYKEGDMELLIVQHEIDHIEGLCQIHDWWEDMDGKQKELQEIFEKNFKPEETESDTGGYGVEESEDLQKEKAEEKLPSELTKEAIEQLKAGEGNHSDNFEEFLEKMKEAEAEAVTAAE